MPPAARVTDLHTCPMAPPPGLPIIPPCAINVLIGFMPAARMTDLCACIGPPPAPVDAIIFGSPTVLIGGLPAARMGDPTAKGGVITTGFPTVLIGLVGIAAPLPPVTPVPVGPVKLSAQDDGSYVAQLGDNLTIEGSKEFVETAMNDLAMLNGTPTGSSLISTIMDSDQPVRIVETSGGNSVTGFTGDAWLNSDGTAGAGSPSTVNYNPERKQIGDGSEDWMTRPPIVGLGHELVHVDQVQNGRLDRATVDGTPHYELEAVGLGDFADAPHTENKIRDELGEPQRPRY